MKICNKCNETKSLNDFSPSKSSKDGFMTYCKVCHNLQNRNNRSKYKEYDKQYAKVDWLRKKTNPTYQLKHKEYQREYKRKKRQDSEYRLKENLRTYFYRVVTNKTKSVFKYLGCDLEEFRLYLEKQFDSCMTWENYGKYWEIDHITPIESFDLKSENDIKKCWDYKNLQPLTINQNRIKRFNNEHTSRHQQMG
jgi:hypothetical protein